MFQLEADQVDKLHAWMAEQDAKVLKRQQEKNPERTTAYYGCQGGAYSYTFIPTSLGMIVKVSNGLTKEEIDLTDYDMW